MTKTMHIADFKSKFSEVVKLLDKGITIKVIKGRAGEVVGFFSKNNINMLKENPRPIGLWQNEKFQLSSEFFNMSEEELNEWGV
jgi:hypothetical protein